MSIQSDIRVVDNVFVKMMQLHFIGDRVEGHAHTFDHITLLAKGSVRMTAKDTSTDYSAPMLIVTPKGIEHAFEALAPDCLICCVHAVRDGEGVDDVASPDITTEQAFELMTQYSLTQD